MRCPIQSKSGRRFGEVRIPAGKSGPVVLVTAALLMVVAMLAGCSSAPDEPDPPVAKVEVSPGPDATNVNPKQPVSVTVDEGTITQLTLTNDEGRQVETQMSPDKRTLRAVEPLGYDSRYNWSGAATGTDGKPVPIEGSFSTVAPKTKTSATTEIGDGQEVGVGAPIVLRFDGVVKDKAAVEKALEVTTEPKVEGSWAWFPDDGESSRVHWRPKEYWKPGTNVHLSANLYGVDMGGGVYGASDLTTDFTVGRSQIVKANAPSHRMQVVRDGQVVFDFPASYGEGNEARNVTRAGTHVITEKFEDFTMSNPPFYENVRERWAVRISNNGEFIHANPESLGSQGAANVTNGCINLSNEDAQAFFPTARYGDPVEVTGTSVPLSAADGFLYDWAIDWADWKEMSALSDEPESGIAAPPAAPAPPRPAAG